MQVSAMTEDDDGEIEFSPLCGSIKQGGRTVRVDIFRLPGEKRWSLAVFGPTRRRLSGATTSRPNAMPTRNSIEALMLKVFRRCWRSDPIGTEPRAK